MRVRAEYDLTKPTSLLALRLEAAGLWSPTQSHFRSVSSSWSSFGWGAREQRTDLMVGLSASISPTPRNGLFYYVTAGIYGRQQRVTGYLSDAATLPGPLLLSPSSASRGDIIGSIGFGLGFRIAGRSLQLEYRHIPGSGALTIGARLPL